MAEDSEEPHFTSGKLKDNEQFQLLTASPDFSSEDEDEWKCDEKGGLVESLHDCSESFDIESDGRVADKVKNSQKTISRMELNTSKAGMEGLDREKINQIIFEASKGSRFYENERKKEKQVQKRIDELQNKMSLLAPEEKFKARQDMDKIVEELESSRDLSRIIVHVDMDAFYAAVEMRDEPNLRSKPMAVGDSAMLCTSNYLARRYGVRAGMPGFIAKKLCPHLVIVPANFQKYTEISQEIREVMAHYDPNYHPMSLDEAYLDITDYVERSRKKKVDLGVATMDYEGVVREGIGNEVEDIVREMRSKIEEKTQLTASAGIAPNMFLAKVCSDRNKPNGQFYLKPERECIMDFVRELPLRKASGIGRVSEQILTSVLKVNTCSGLHNKRDIMHLLFTPTACRSYLEISLGLGSTVVDVNRERKSMSTETTFREINKPEEHFSKCYDLCRELSKSLKEKGLVARKVGIKLKTVNFDVKTRVCTLTTAVQEPDELFCHAKKLVNNEIKACLPQPLRLRLMGVRAAELCHMEETAKEPKQLTIVSLLKQGGNQSSSSRMKNPVSCSEPELALQSADLTGGEEEGILEISGNGSLVNDKGNRIESSGNPVVVCAPSDIEQERSMNDTEEPGSNNIKEVVPCGQTNLVCPVCGKNLSFNCVNPLLQFNQHVDLCLNTQTIADVLKEDSANTRDTNQEQSTSKKRKRTSPNAKAKRRTIDHFLMK